MRRQDKNRNDRTALQRSARKNACARGATDACSHRDDFGKHQGHRKDNDEENERARQSFFAVAEMASASA
jgi:hypothetical protein